MKLRGPIALAAVVLAAAAAAVGLVLVPVILVGRYQATLHAIKKSLNLSNWCGVKNPAHQSSSSYTQKMHSQYPQGSSSGNMLRHAQISLSSRYTVDRTCNELNIT
jgi:hypothetical protein